MTDFALLHGGGQGSWVWEPVVSRLETAGARVLALDVPGCGTKRDRDTSALGPDEVVAEVLADIVDAGLSDVVMVGHSQAGSILPSIYAAQPTLFARLVYLTCSIPLPHQSVVSMMGKGEQGSHPDEVGWPADPNKLGREAQRAQMFTTGMSEAEKALYAASERLDNWPYAMNFATGWTTDHLAGSPATYILCERDGALPVAWQERFADRFHCQHIVRIDAGHQAMTTHPAEVTALLLAEAARSDGS
jgi:pimeloyl-ACP methyl ester carboxylesterase